MGEFQEGNKAAEKWTEESAKNLIETMRDNAKNDEGILSLQDAILSVDLYTTSLNYIIDKFPVFENIKKDINDIIIARINRGALKGDYNPTAGIWRMKQLGEKDEKVVDNKSSDGSMRPLVLAEETARAISKKVDDSI
ncbi:MAG: hypothetical protein GY928_14800 [Colwellia sp.]|nr:hypothetical protein [Colwellia sp.]